MRRSCVRTLMLLAQLAVVVTVLGCSEAPEPEAASIDVSQLPLDKQMLDASISGDLDRVEALVAAYPNIVHLRGDFNRTPLHFAAANGRNNVVEFLLENGADPRALDDDGFPPQAAAQQWDHLDTAKIIAAAANPAGDSGQ